MSPLFPARAVNVQQMKQRLDRAVDKPVQQVNAKAEQIICKTERKPVCYADGAVIEAGYALVRITRPEGQSYFVLFQQKDNAWKPIYSRKLEKLSLSLWKADKVHISDTLAARMIQKLQALR
ncbi:MAG: hypothetical protein ACO1RX_05340 [Candidatus Sericytochromatia bacterium]